MNKNCQNARGSMFLAVKSVVLYLSFFYPLWVWQNTPLCLNTEWLFSAYKRVERSVSALPPERFLTPTQPGRHVKTRTQLTSTTNVMENYVRNDDRCFCVLLCHTAQYKNSFFPCTIMEPPWQQCCSCRLSGQLQATDSTKRAILNFPFILSLLSFFHSMHKQNSHPVALRASILAYLAT